MNIIYLPGNSFHNKTWIEKVKSEFDVFSSGEILDYDHWRTKDKWINLEKESKKLAKLVKNKKGYFVFAKSIGSILALKNIFEKTLNPKKLIICGHPYEMAKQDNLPVDEYLKTLVIPTVFIQNEFDPVYSFTELEKVLTECSPADYQLMKIPNNETHDYEDLAELAVTVKKFFNKR